MGGYDLYGNYYAKTQDALNAELAQMNEIDNGINRRKLEDQEHEIQFLRNRINKLEKLLSVKPLAKSSETKEGER